MKYGLLVGSEIRRHTLLCIPRRVRDRGIYSTDTDILSSKNQIIRWSISSASWGTPHERCRFTLLNQKIWDWWRVVIWCRWWQNDDQLPEEIETVASSEEAWQRERAPLEITRAHVVSLCLGPKNIVSDAVLGGDGCFPRILRFFVLLDGAVQRKQGSLPASERPGLLKRLFIVVCTCHIMAYSITVGTCVLYDHVSDLRVALARTFEAFERPLEEQWRFSPMVLCSQRWNGIKFTQTLEVNGTSVSMHFVKSRPASSNETRFSTVPGRQWERLRGGRGSRIDGRHDRRRTSL